MKYSRRTKYKRKCGTWPVNLRRLTRSMKKLAKPTAEAVKAIEEMGIRMDRVFREGKNPILNAGWMRIK